MIELSSISGYEVDDEVQETTPKDEAVSVVEPVGPARCQALTRSGQPCRNRPIAGERYCRAHLARPAAMAVGDTSAATEAVFEASVAAPADEDSQRRQLRDEVNRLAEVVERMAPLGYTPPPFSPAELLRLVEDNLRRLSPELRAGIVTSLRQSLSADVLDVDTWKGLWTMLNYLLEYQGDLLKRRLRGQYEVDPYGYDPDFTEWVQPFFQFMYHRYWRVETSGLEHVPDAGRAMLVANHSGVLPWDGAMIITAVNEEHPSPRLVRAGVAEWFPTLPFLSVFLTKIGQVLAHPENLTRLLSEDELVLVFPEGYKGVGKLFRDRYRLARFGRGGFVRIALQTQAPIIPVAVTGSEEIYPVLYKSDTVARLIGFPFFPISPFFPLFGPLGFVPLPAKWSIDFGEPLDTSEYGPEAAENVSLVAQLTDEVRSRVQDMLYERLKKRRSIFLG